MKSDRFCHLGLAVHLKEGRPRTWRPQERAFGSNVLCFVPRPRARTCTDWSPRTGLDETPQPGTRPRQTVGKHVEGTNNPDLFSLSFYRAAKRPLHPRGRASKICSYSVLLSISRLYTGMHDGISTVRRAMASSSQPIKSGTELVRPPPHPPTTTVCQL